MSRMELFVGSNCILLLLLARPVESSSTGSWSLRRTGFATTKPKKGSKGKSEKPTDTKDIHAKYDKMDDFLKAMFVIGCDWKNSKDVHDYAAQGLTKGTMTTDEFAVELVKTQDKELVALKQACGMIVASQMKDCRQGCATRWNSLMDERHSCDEKCETRYNKFERLCIEKADHLKDLYALTAKLNAAKKQCYEEWCPKVPTVWVMAEEKKMKKEVDKRCETYCKEDTIKMRCTKKFQLEIDFVLGSVKVECSAKSGATECFKKKKESATEKKEKCSKKAKNTCKDALEKCEKKADEREAKAFCAKRKKMCDEQASEKCLTVYAEGVDKVKKECEAENKKKIDECTEKAVKKKEEEAMKKCTKKKTESCPDDCHDGCKVDKMNKCLDNLKQPSGTRDFCEDFWLLIEESSQLDPLTGDPAVEKLEAL